MAKERQNWWRLPEKVAAEYLKKLPNYNKNLTQTLKNVNGSFEWVDDAV